MREGVNRIQPMAAFCILHSHPASSSISAIFRSAGCAVGHVIFHFVNPNPSVSPSLPSPIPLVFSIPSLQLSFLCPELSLSFQMFWLWICIGTTYQMFSLYHPLLNLDYLSSLPDSLFPFSMLVSGSSSLPSPSPFHPFVSAIRMKGFPQAYLCFLPISFSLQPSDNVILI